MITCLSCQQEPEERTHKDAPVLACPGCGEILFRPISGEEVRIR